STRRRRAMPDKMVVRGRIIQKTREPVENDIVSQIHPVQLTVHCHDGGARCLRAWRTVCTAVRRAADQRPPALLAVSRFIAQGLRPAGIRCGSTAVSRPRPKSRLTRWI